MKKESKNIKFSVIRQLDSISSWLNLSSILMLLGFIQIWILTFYYKVNMNEWIGWIANDGNVGKPFSFGVHYFGHYYAMHRVAISHLLSFEGNSYPPLGVLPFYLLVGFPYRIGLFFWMFILMLSLCYPIYDVRRNRILDIWPVAVVLFALLTVPSIATLDRANSVGILTLLIYLFYKKLITNRDNLASIWLGLAIGIKIYPAVLLPFLILKRKYKIAILSTLNAIIFNLAFLIIWERGDLIKSLKYIINRVIGVENLLENGHGLYLSASQIFVNLLNRMGLIETDLGKLAVENYRFIALICLAILLLGAWKAPSNYWILYALSAIQIIPTQSFSYYRFWSIIGIAIILNSQAGTLKFHRFTKFEQYWLLILILNLTPLTLLFLWPVNILPTLVLALVLLGPFVFKDEKMVRK